LNNRELIVKDGLNVRELLLEGGYDPELVSDLLVIKKKTNGESVYDLATSKGVVRVSTEIPLEDIPVPTSLYIKSTQSMYFGPIKNNTITTKKPGRTALKEKDVFFLKEEDTYLSFALKDQVVQDAIRIGSVIGGFNTLATLSEGDKIVSLVRLADFDVKRIEPHEELKDGDKICSEMHIMLTDSPVSSERLFGYVRTMKNVFHVDGSTNSFIMALPDVKGKIPKESVEAFREMGEIFIRNSGEKVGGIYIYRKRRFPSVYFNKIGKITFGIELLQVAKENDSIFVRVYPKSCFVVGKTQIEAGEYLEKLGIVQVRMGSTKDDSIVVDQIPAFTLEIHKNKKVKTIGLDKEELIHIELYTEDAPNSVNYFKEASNLIYSPKIGKLRVEYNTGSLILFQMPEIRKNVLPENSIKPEETTGLVGITNSSRPQYGRIGIRIKPDQNFGPTGEEFTATNIIGRVTKGLDRLSIAKKDDYVYFEVKEA